mgnify:CR=1 FL=1
MGTLQETARNLIDRGAEVVSGLASSAGDAASKAKIKMKITDLSLEEGKLMQQLGREAYERLKDDAGFREAHAELLERIEETSAHKQALEDELEAMGARVEDAGDMSDPQPIDVDAVVVSDGASASKPADTNASEKDAE